MDVEGPIDEMTPCTLQKNYLTLIMGKKMNVSLKKINDFLYRLKVSHSIQ